MPMIAGIDEAGRGPVLGPMVMVIAAADTGMMNELVEMGVRDSKALSVKRRKVLSKQLKELIDYEIASISPQEVDAAVNSASTNLNWLEADVSARIARKLYEQRPFTKLYLDCPSNNIPAYSNYFQKALQIKQVKVIAEHKADERYPIVSAASIIAKVYRDMEIWKWQESSGIDCGSGYPSDPKTIEFIKKYGSKYPQIIRKSWDTYKRLSKLKNQRNLSKFL